MFPRYGDTRGMDHVRLYPRANQKPSRPASKASAIRATSLPALTASSRQRCSRPAAVLGSAPASCAADAQCREHTANQPARLAEFDSSNDCAILIQGDEGPAQVIQLGHNGTPSVFASDDGAVSSPPPPYHLSAGGNRIRTLGPPESSIPYHGPRPCWYRRSTGRRRGLRSPLQPTMIAITPEPPVWA
jgi:hypothetical protein